MPGFSRATISRTMTEFEKHGKTSRKLSNSGRTYKLTDRDRPALRRIAGRKHKITAARVTAQLNQHLNHPVFTKTVRRVPNSSGYHIRAAIRKPLLLTIIIQKGLKWCRDHKGWSADQWKQVIVSDESSFSLFSTAGRVYVRGQPREAYNPDCLLLTVTHGGGSVMALAAISWNHLDPIVVLHGMINSKD